MAIVWLRIANILLFLNHPWFGEGSRYPFDKHRLGDAGFWFNNLWLLYLVETRIEACAITPSKRHYGNSENQVKPVYDKGRLFQWCIFIVGTSPWRYASHKGSLTKSDVIKSWLATNNSSYRPLLPLFRVTPAYFTKFFFLREEMPFTCFTPNIW